MNCIARDSCVSRKSRHGHIRMKPSLCSSQQTTPRRLELEKVDSFDVHKREEIMKQSTTRIRKAFRDPVTGEKSYVWADKITYRYDELEKGPIIVEFLKGALNAEEFVEKYHICSVQTLYAWVGKFLTQQESVSLSEQNDIDMARKSKDDQIKELKEELKKAQKEAEMQKLRATAYDKMIDLAEETFNIPIRKKSGTKQ